MLLLLLLFDVSKEKSLNQIYDLLHIRNASKQLNYYIVSGIMLFYIRAYFSLALRRCNVCILEKAFLPYYNTFNFEYSLIRTNEHLFIAPPPSVELN